MYARRKHWPLETIRVHLRHSKVHATDCADCETQAAKLDRIERDIELVGALDDEQRARLLEIADRCPVHRTLTSTIDIKTRLVGMGARRKAKAPSKAPALTIRHISWRASRPLRARRTPGFPERFVP